MMTISVIKDAKRAEQYFRQNDYYTGNAAPAIAPEAPADAAAGGADGLATAAISAGQASEPGPTGPGSNDASPTSPVSDGGAQPAPPTASEQASAPAPSSGDELAHPQRQDSVPAGGAAGDTSAGTAGRRDTTAITAGASSADATVATDTSQINLLLAQKVAGQWAGEGARRQGLSGPVEPQQFRAILKGHLPDGSVISSGRSGAASHRPGYDLTFSAPKSVSILALAGNDTRLIDAHHQAVQTALEWIEQSSVTYRRKGFFRFDEVRSDNLMAAKFTHATSRENDPNLHTHAAVMNATQRPDTGRWVAIASESLFAAQSGGNVYRAALAQAVQDLGYQVIQTRADGTFEIDGVPDEVIKTFSKRREAIEQALKDHDLDGRRASETMALMTRPEKAVTNPDHLRALWALELQRKSFDIDDFVEKAKAAALSLAPREAVAPALVDASIRLAMDRLSEREAAFTHHAAVKWALADDIASHNLNDVQRGLERAYAAGFLIPAETDKETGWTTPKARFQEQSIIQMLLDTKGSCAPLLEKQVLTDMFQQVGTLSGGQEDALTLIGRNQDQVIGIQGRAGAGKTFMLGLAQKALTEAGNHVLGLALSRHAAMQLEREAELPSQTLAKHLFDLRKDIAQHVNGSADVREAIERKYEKDIWIVDEASQADLKTTRDLLSSARRLGARVVLVGDTKQLAAVAAGKPFDLLQRSGMQVVHMTQSRRQQVGHHQRAVEQSYDGKYKEALATLGRETSVIKDVKKRMQAMIRVYQVDPDNTMMLTLTNKGLDTLNEGARDVHRARGDLGPDQGKFKALNKIGSLYADRQRHFIYEKGDIVHFLKDNKRLGIQRGEYRRIAGTTRDGRVMLISDSDEKDQQMVLWKPSANLGIARTRVEISRPIERSLAIGDKLRWTRNDNEKGLHNQQHLTVAKIDGTKLELFDPLTERRFEIDTKERSGQYWNYAYASTVYSSQGRTVGRIAVNLDMESSNLVDQKAFLVAISRHQHEIALFTDDADRLRHTIIEQTGDKTGAHESIDERRWRGIAELAHRIASSLMPSARARTPKNEPSR